MIDNQWDKFKPILKSQKNFKVYMDRLATYRNTVSHTRPLLPFEEAIVYGLTGEIRNSVAIWRSTQGPDMKYYPEITSVMDSHGFQTSGKGGNTNLTLRPGETVTFKCVATDPEGRTLNWQLNVLDQTFTADTVDTAVGEEVALTWEVKDSHVRDNQTAMVMLSSESQYHRNGSYDSTVHLYYKVEPRLVKDDSPTEHPGDGG